MIVVPGATQSVHPESFCASCHEKEAATEKNAPHSRAEIRCVDCYGGDATEKAKRPSKTTDTGHLSKFTKKRSAEARGDWHADIPQTSHGPLGWGRRA